MQNKDRCYFKLMFIENTNQPTRNLNKITLLILNKIEDGIMLLAEREKERIFHVILIWQ